MAEKLAKAKQKLAAARGSKPAAARADTDQPAQPYAYKQACAEAAASESPLQQQQEEHAEWLRNKQRMQEERAAEWLKRMSAVPEPFLPDTQPSPPADAEEAAEAPQSGPKSSRRWRRAAPTTWRGSGAGFKYIF